MKTKKKNPASHHSYEYHLFFFFHYLNDLQAISNLCQNKDFYMARLCIINLFRVPFTHITSHADFRRTSHRSKSYSPYGVLNSYPRSIMFLEEAVSLHFFPCFRQKTKLRVLAILIKSDLKLCFSS